jgi:predicted O-methyltransferase YrrM
MNPGELEMLVALVCDVQPKVMIEIGVNEGRTARLMLNTIPSIESYIGVDVLPNYVPAKTVQRWEVPARPGHLAAADPRFELVLKERGSLDLAESDLPQCNVLFIDGDHGREAVSHDSALARRLVSEGMIIWHDYHDLDVVDVREVLDEFYLCGADIHHVENTWLAFERRQ